MGWRPGIRWLSWCGCTGWRSRSPGPPGSILTGLGTSTDPFGDSELILVVSLNPALDLTYEVDAADWAGVNRPHTVHVRPGGKGVNVARTLRALGCQVRLAGLIGGSARV